MKATRRGFLAAAAALVAAPAALVRSATFPPRPVLPSTLLGFPVRVLGRVPHIKPAVSGGFLVPRAFELELRDALEGSGVIVRELDGLERVRASVVRDMGEAEDRAFMALAEPDE